MLSASRRFTWLSRSNCQGNRDNLQESQAKDHDQQDLLALRELQRVDERDRQRENNKIRRDVNTGRDVPNGETVEACIGHRGIYLAHGHTTERNENRLDNIPRASEGDDA